MKKGLLVVAAVLYGSLAIGQSRIYVNEYLNIGVGARGLAMAGATSATTSDVYSSYWNPAGLMGMESDYQGGFMHAEYFAGIFKYDYGAVAMPLKKKDRALGISFIRFATDNIPYTLDYVQPDGSFNESLLKEFSAGDYAVLLSYAQKLNLFKKDTNIQTRIGANAKVLYRNVGSMAKAWGMGIDIGFQTLYKSWRFGITAKDITTSYTAWTFNLSQKEKEIFTRTGNEIPIKSYEVMLPRFNFGVAKYLLKPESNVQVIAELGFDVTTDGQRNTIIASKPISIDPRMGIEASYKNTIFVRAGIGNFYRALDNADTNNVKKYTVFQPSVGVGFKLKSIVVDYAFTSLQMQDNPLMSHVISGRIDIYKQKRKQHEEGVSPENIFAPQPQTAPENKNK